MALNYHSSINFKMLLETTRNGASRYDAHTCRHTRARAQHTGPIFVFVWSQHDGGNVDKRSMAEVSSKTQCIG